jgi:hypothetical protein
MALVEQAVVIELGLGHGEGTVVEVDEYADEPIVALIGTRLLKTTLVLGSTTFSRSCLLGAQFVPGDSTQPTISLTDHRGSVGREIIVEPLVTVLAHWKLCTVRKGH